MSNSKVVRFLGLSLGGGKTDRVSLAVIDYYPSQKKIFLSKIFDKIKSSENISADAIIIDLIQQYRHEALSLSIDCPTAPPPCLLCELKCPGFEDCDQEHIRWLWDFHRKMSIKRKPKKLFTPYTQRAAELWFSSQLEEPFQIPHCMGANQAPILARAQFLKRRLDPKLEILEIIPRASLWRIGRSLHINKSTLRTYKHSISGDSSRRQILEHIADKKIVFIYEQDQKLMIESPHAFDSFFCAWTGLLKFLNLTESPPKNFPKKESWIEVPLSKLNYLTETK